ncbi:unnamed protein product [Psylliodes chrysocephalus]|uniref:EDR1/CTR1/ARMC3-like peptidase-like domain-containing protein n=1 Tax=Psylliodes chrysocephalus TaxID=3402493 RepID=A0A9P0CQK1_9CUCU|nr:unnamed protein product [Psylliodes chrysocephala]
MAAAKGHGKKANKLDSKSPDDIKEKTYLTRHVETSISILESPENDIVLEALLFLSKYADIRLVNLTYLQQRGLLKKLLNLFDRNICILRLALRLLNILLSIDDVMVEFNRGIYDNQIKQITDFYICHDDNYVREFSVNILIKLATTCRITCLIFSVDLLNPILQTLQSKKSEGLLKTTIRLLDVLLSSPAVLSVLPELQKFDVTVILDYMNDNDNEIARLTFNIVAKLTMFGLDVYQSIFRFHHLVEKMMEVVMDPAKKENHEIALQIILNCMNSDLTSSYFVESIQFLKLCAWVKSCDTEYLRPCVEIYSKLSAMPQMRQVLFDLSVEESILYFLRSNNKYILNKTCEAISNMSEHKYCCEQMMTPVVMRVLCSMLERNDDEDPENAVAIKTITDLMRRSLKTIDFLNHFGAQQTFIELFKKGMSAFTQESYFRILEVLYQFSVHPIYKESVVCGKFFEELFNILQNGTEDIANLSVEMLTYFIPHPEFYALLVKTNGPQIILEKLKTTKNPQLFKSLLVLIHSTLSNESFIMEFMKRNLVKTLKDFSDYIKQKAPLINTILKLSYDVYLPLKFFEMHRMELTDKLNNQFYLISGKWTDPFPFLGVFLHENLSPIRTIYVVDFSYEMVKSKQRVPTPNSKEVSCRSTPRTDEQSPITHLISTPYEIKYGDLSPDPFLPSYIYHIREYFKEETDIIDKIKMLAEYVDTILCGPDETLNIPQKFHTFKLHIQTLKFKLGTNMIPIGYLRVGFHCEKALLFKALADSTCIPCSLVKGAHNLYWNEVAVFSGIGYEQTLTIYIVDLMNNIGNLMAMGSKEANYYCNSSKYKSNNYNKI